MSFIFIFISSSDPNLLPKKSVKQKIKKRWPKKKKKLSLVIRKPAFCICESKDADQRICFRYIY